MPLTCHGAWVKEVEEAKQLPHVVLHRRACRGKQHMGDTQKRSLKVTLHLLFHKGRNALLN